MQSSRTWFICRAHNRFTPSKAQWPHVIAPAQCLGHQQRLVSSAGQASHTHENQIMPSEGSHESAEKERTKKTDHGKPHVQIRKMQLNGIARSRNPEHAAALKAYNALFNKREAQLQVSRKQLEVTKAAVKAGTDYTGVVIAPMKSPEPFKESHLPWCLRLEERNIPCLDRLAAEIKRFSEYARPSRFDEIARKNLMKRVYDAVTKRIPNWNLEVFGSQRTGIALATSDIDFRLMDKLEFDDPALAKLPPKPAHRRKGKAILAKLHKALLRHEDFKLVFIRHARYPLISMQDPYSGLEAQIVLANNTSESQSIMQDYMRRYPYLLSLFTVVKTIFDVRGLSEVFYGGFGSYSLFMMIVASIVHHPHPRNDAAGALIHFLDFWGKIDTTKYGVSIEPVALFEKASVSVMTTMTREKIKQGETKPLPKYMMCLRDPADSTNDLGRKGMAIKHIQVTLCDLHSKLNQALEDNSRPSLLNLLVDPVYTLHHARREMLRKNGQETLNAAEDRLARLAKKIREKDVTEPQPNV